jgi:hypothetical protein
MFSAFIVYPSNSMFFFALLTFPLRDGVSKTTSPLIGFTDIFSMPCFCKALFTLRAQLLQVIPSTFQFTFSIINHLTLKTNMQSYFIDTSIAVCSGSNLYYIVAIRLK